MNIVDKFYKFTIILSAVLLFAAGIVVTEKMPESWWYMGLSDGMSWTALLLCYGRLFQGK